MTELSGYRQKAPPWNAATTLHQRKPLPPPGKWFMVAAIFFYVALWRADWNAEADGWLQDLMGYLWRCHVIQGLGFSERDAAAYLATPYGSQGDIARVLGVDQATVSRAQKRVRASLLAEGWDFDFAPKEGRRALYRPRLRPAA